MITGQGIRTAFGTKPLKLPYASGKTLKHFLPPGVRREEAVGSTEWSHERSPCSQLATSHLTSLLKLPLSRRQTQELYHGASKERPAPRTDATWVACCEMTDPEWWIQCLRHHKARELHFTAIPKGSNGWATPGVVSSLQSLHSERTESPSHRAGTSVNQTPQESWAPALGGP